MEELAPLLLIAVMVLVFWLLIMRPNVRRQKQQIAMQESLQVGEQVMLTSGFYGTLRGLEDDRVVGVGHLVLVEVGRRRAFRPVAGQTHDRNPDFT